MRLVLVSLGISTIPMILVIILTLRYGLMDPLSLDEINVLLLSGVWDLAGIFITRNSWINTLCSARFACVYR